MLVALHFLVVFAVWALLYLLGPGTVLELPMPAALLMAVAAGLLNAGAGLAARGRLTPGPGRPTVATCSS